MWMEGISHAVLALAALVALRTRSSEVPLSLEQVGAGGSFGVG